MGLSRTVSEIDGDFSRKSQNFPTPCILRPRWRVPVGIGYRRLGSKNYNDGATEPTKKFDDIFSRLDRCTLTDGRTDRQTDTGHSKDRIASRGKNFTNQSITRINKRMKTSW